MVLPRWRGGKESACQCRRPGFDPWVKKIPWRRKWHPTPVFLPREPHGQRSLAAYSPWGGEELDSTQQLNHHHHHHLEWHLSPPSSQAVLDPLQGTRHLHRHSSSSSAACLFCGCTWLSCLCPALLPVACAEKCRGLSLASGPLVAQPQFLLCSSQAMWFVCVVFTFMCMCIYMYGNVSVLADLVLLRFFTWLRFTNTPFFASEACGDPALSKSASVIFPTVSAHFMSLWHILVILKILQAFSLLLYLWWWPVISDLGCYYCEKIRTHSLKAQMIAFCNNAMFLFKIGTLLFQT